MADDLIAAAEAEIADERARRSHSHAEMAAIRADVWERTARELQQQRNDYREGQARALGDREAVEAEMDRRVTELMHDRDHALTERDGIAGRKQARINELAAEVERLRANRDAIADSLSRAWDAAGIPDPSSVMDLADEITAIRETLAEKRTERDDARRELAEVTRQRDTLRAGVAELADAWGRESQRCKTSFDRSTDPDQRDRLDVAVRTYRAAEVGTRTLLDTQEPAVKPYAAAAIRCRYCGHNLPGCRCEFDQAGGQPDQKGPETAPSATETAEDPTPSVPGTVSAQTLDLPASQAAEVLRAQVAAAPAFPVLVRVRMGVTPEVALAVADLIDAMRYAEELIGRANLGKPLRLEMLEALGAAFGRTARLEDLIDV